jgi:hypothetical protein
MSLRAIVLLAGLLGQQPPEERIDDTEYEKAVAVHVKAVQAVEKTWRKDPAAGLKSIEAALKAVEEELAPRHPRLIEATIAVRATRGIDKGEVKDRFAFFPYRLAGEIALAAGEPERAVVLLQKSPSGASLLADARKAVAAKKDPPPTDADEADVRPEAVPGAARLRGRWSLRTQRAALGADADRIVERSAARRRATSRRRSRCWPGRCRA